MENKEILKKLQSFKLFVTEIIDFIPSKQQLDFIDNVEKIIQCKIKKNIYNEVLTREEEYYASRLGITVMSARGTGKDCILAIFILWFVLIYNCKIPVTAPTGTALSTVLWSEIKKWHNKIKYDCIKSLYIITNDKVKCSSSGYESFAIGRASGNKNAQALSGYHEDYMPICIDEAASVPDEVFEPLELTLTGPINFMILIWNPTSLSGYAYDSYYHSELSKRWIKLHWSALESENVTKESIERVKERHGEKSNFYRVSVLGIPPKEDSSMLIPIRLARYCMEKQYDELTEVTVEMMEKLPLVIGIDPSRSGANGCDTICTVRKGNLIREFYVPEEQADSAKMVDEIVDKLFSRYDFDFCFVETNGLGGPIYDMLNRYNKDKIIPVNVADKDVPEDYFNMRSMLWCRLRDSIINKHLALNKEMDKNDYETFIQQITDIKQDNVSIQNTGKFKIKIESKKDMASRGVQSPDYGDATILTFYYTQEQILQRLSNRSKSDKYYSHDDYEGSGWMG